MESQTSDSSSSLDKRGCLRTIIETKRFEVTIGIIILFNMFVIIRETDAMSTKSPVPEWINSIGFAMLGLYIIELIAKLAVYRSRFFLDVWNVMDFVVVGSDVVLAIIDQFVTDMPKVSALRVLRLVRLARAFKAASMFKELEMLLRGFFYAFKAIFWGVIMVFLMLTIWSILAVQFINPLNKDVAATGIYGDCERCARAFETTFQSLLTFFQTVVAGDSWGQVAVPIVEHFPLAGPFFLAVLVSVSLATMNLILAVIVDSAQDSRDSMAKDQDAEDQTKFAHLCKQMDAHSSGTLTKEQVLDGLQNPEYAKLVGTHHLQRSDLQILIDSMTDEHTHSISHEGVVAMLRRLRNPDNTIVLLELAKLQLKLQEHVSPAMHVAPAMLANMQDDAAVQGPPEQPHASVKHATWNITDDELMQVEPMLHVKTASTANLTAMSKPGLPLAKQKAETSFKAITPNETEMSKRRMVSKQATVTFTLLPPWDSAQDDIYDEIHGEDDNNDFDEIPLELEGEEEPLPNHKYFFIASPNSKWRVFWDLTGMMCLGWDMIMIPLQLSFQATGALITVMNWCTLIFWTTDIPLAFCVGYYSKTGEFVGDPRRIAFNYMRSWFLLDFLIVSMDWLPLVMEGRAQGLMKLGKMLRVLRILRTLRLLRLAKLKQLMAMIQDRLDSEFLTIGLNVCKLMVVIVAINHFIACAWYKLGTVRVDGFDSWVYKDRFDQTSFSYRYLSSLHWSLTQFTPASMSVQPVNVGERVFAVLVLLFAMIVFSSFVSSITAAMNQLRNLSARNGSQLWILRKFLREQQINQDLYVRLVRYAAVTSERMTRKVQQKDVQFLHLLSAPLKSELSAALFRPIIISYPLFERLSRRCPSLTNRMCCSGMKPMSLWRGDILFHAGEQASGLYRMTSGQARYAWTSAAGQLEMNYVKEKLWLAEAALWVSWVHVGRLQALQECNVFHLDASKFRELVKFYPTQLPYLKQFARRVLERLADGSQDNTDVEANLGRSASDNSKFGSTGPERDSSSF